jgi:uncharacterized membrane protein
LEIAELRPLSLGELLDRTFTVYKSNFWVFAGIMAIPAALGIPVTFFVLRFDTTLLANPTQPFVPSPAQVFGFVGLYLAFVFLWALVYAIVAGAMTFAVSEAYLGRKSTIAASYKSLRGKVWRLFGVSLNVMLRILGIAILVTLVVGGVGVLLISAMAFTTQTALSGTSQIVVGMVIVVMVLALYALIVATMVYLALRYAVAIPALALENLGVLASIRRSVRLTKGRRGQVFVAMLLAFIISVVGSMVFYMPFYIPTMIMMVRDHSVPAWLSLLSAIFAALGTCATSPIFMIVLVLCYYDTRVRKEAFDLQFMMASLERPADAASTVPSA